MVNLIKYVPVTKLKSKAKCWRRKSCSVVGCVCVFQCVCVCVSQAECDSELDVSCCVYRQERSVLFNVCVSPCMHVQNISAFGDRFGGQRECVRVFV